MTSVTDITTEQTPSQKTSSLKAKPIYFKNLDGLRFFAFLIVFISHATLFLGYNNDSGAFSWIKKYILINGDVGVSFFFVLSGFLITYLLLREKDASGKISLKHFYLRRILRIWPVYFTTLIIGFFILPAVAHLIISTGFFPFIVNPPFRALPNFIFLLANFSLFHGSTSVQTDVLWSISVEEQFYLVWPWVIAFLPRKHLLKFLGGIIFISCVYRYFNAISPNIIAYSTFSVMSDLAIGSVLAFLIYTKNNVMVKVFSKIKTASPAFIGSAYVFLFLIICGRHYIAESLLGRPLSYNLFIALFPLVLASTYAFVIFEQNESSRSLFKIGKSESLSFLGRISYGLYSYHIFAFATVILFAYMLGFNLIYTSTLQWFVFAGLSLITAFVFAIISYFGMEKWFLKMKPKD